MKTLVSIVAIAAILSSSCQEKSPKKESQKAVTEEVAEKESSSYPEFMDKLFNRHGGIDNWNSRRQLSFENDGATITTDLRNRMARIENKDNAFGFDGKNVWVLEKDGKPFEGNAKLYYNLMFYFYAMPFVLGDDGITYEKTDALVFEGKSYPGMLISYGDGVGASSKDNYRVYADPDTGEMAWLAYTFTFLSQEKSDKFNIIKYQDWENVNGLKLPKSISWFNADDSGNPTEVKNTVNFTNSKLSKTVDGAFFTMPEGAKVVE